jgi:4-aminobutyrate aminotransferase-like enzyme
MLLDDDEAAIPKVVPFKGLDLASAGSFPFAKRVSPGSLRYDEQEQGNKWIDVFAGAIVAHSHQYIELKQDEYIRRQLVALSDKLIDDNSIKVTEALVEYYVGAARITR